MKKSGYGDTGISIPVFVCSKVVAAMRMCADEEDYPGDH